MSHAITPDTWRQLCDYLAQSGGHINRCADDVTRIDLLQSLTMSLNPMYLSTMSDPDYPEFIPCCNNAIPIASANPDYNYYYTAVNDDGIYRLSGRRGTSLFVGIQCCREYSIFTNKPGPTFKEYMLDDLTIGADGSFDVILSKKRPQGWQGDWWEMPDTTDYLFVRHCSYDWLNERDAEIAIERTDVRPNRKRRSPDVIKAAVERVFKKHVLSNDLWLQIIEAQRKAGAINTLRFIDFAQWGGVPAQVYYEGNFDLKPDEALIMEAPVPKKVLYWGVQLTDEVYMCLEAQHRQGSLNGHQAHVDEDGVFRAVLCWDDPGIQNWLDIQGYPRGSICGRWNKADSAPLPTMKKVKFSEIDQHLPTFTKRVTPAEREEQLRARRKGYQLRRRW